MAQPCTILPGVDRTAYKSPGPQPSPVGRSRRARGMEEIDFEAEVWFTEKTGG